jgi:hypothetical protein
MKLLKTSCLLIAALFCIQPQLWSQETRGTLLGRVIDQSGGVIVGARVEATNTETGVHSTTTSNETGDFLLPFLIPGPYSLQVEAPGFKKFVRGRVDVRVNERITIDVAMEVGQTADTIQVSAEAPLLDTSTTSIGQVIDSRTILELPLKDGMVLIMATLSPGVLFQPQSPGYVRPFDTSSPSQLSIDGTRTGSSEFMLDGAPNMQRAEVAYSPPPGVVDEFKIQTATFDAAYGYMAGGALNMSLKSGTNKLNGQLYYFHQNPMFNANRFFLNRIGAPKLRFRLHRWGTSFGGPVIIPKLYNGENKTFWMYGYEGIWSFDPTPFVTQAVPTAAQRNGDFSALLALGPQYQIYDPYTTTAEPGGLFRRQPLPGNIIPQSRINPVAQKIVALWDQPNQRGTSDGMNNYTRGKNAQDTYWNHIIRVDHNLSAMQRFYVRTNFTLMDRPENERHNRAFGDVFVRQNRGFAFDHVYTISPRFFVNSRYSYTRFINAFTPMQLGWDLAGLGFASSYIQQINQVDSRALRLPEINVTRDGSTQGGNPTLSSETLNKRHSDTHDFALNATNLVNTHTLRYGAGFRVYRENTFNLGASSGSLNFDTGWTRGPLSTSTSAPIGQGLASFLYGLPTGGSFPINTSYAQQTKIWAFYLQDDWKISRKLTVSLGLRYELPGPLTERFNRTVRGFDFAAANPIEEQARANYARNPIPELPVGQFRARGGLTFAGVNGEPRTLWNTNTMNFMPRIGIAYSITPNTVLRAGYGIYFEPIGVINLNVTQTGFSRSTSLVASLDNGQNYIASLTNPFPNSFLLPSGSTGGLSTNVGQGVSFFNEALANPYMQRWQFSVQQGLPGRGVLELSYVGNRGTRQRIGRDLNALPNNYLSTLAVRDQNTINFLNAAVPNPFYPMLPGTNLAGTTVQRNQLLRPYPQFTSVNMDTNQGYSWYHSMQVRYEKRFSAGLSSTLSWTWSKLMEARGFLNAGDAMPEEVISDQDRTHRIAITSLYELPFGQGRRWGSSMNGVVSKIISGWQVQGIYTGQTGAPLGFGNAIFVGNLQDIVLPRSQRTVERWFNTAAGFDTSSARQLDRNLRTLSTRFSGIRGDGGNNWDLSVIKNTEISEGIRLQFRAEAINALNHPQFLAPNTTPTSTAFGTVTDEWTWPRVIQFGMKILF